MTYFKYHSKNIFYQEEGMGFPTIFLHGNTASSKMFTLLLPLYTSDFKTILIDFLGHGQSDRLDTFPEDLWYQEALQTISLIEHLGYTKVNLIGTSGGAWVSMNTALLRPDVVNKVVIDSCNGRTLHDGWLKHVLKDRDYARKDPNASQFYAWCQGEDWSTIVDLDTEFLIQLVTKKRSIFCKPLNSLKSSVLLIGSLEDKMIRKDILQEYEGMVKEMKNARMHIFKTGGHPTIVTQAEQVSKLIHKFLLA